MPDPEQDDDDEDQGRETREMMVPLPVDGKWFAVAGAEVDHGLRSHDR